MIITHKMNPTIAILVFITIASTIPSISSLDFLYDTFQNSVNRTNVTLISDAHIDSPVIRLTNDSIQFSYGRAFYPVPLNMKSRTSNSSSRIASFSTSFVFSVLPEISTSPGFGFTFVLTNSTSPAGAMASQYFGLFSNATVKVSAPLLAVEFDMGQNPEFNDLDSNHVGIDLNSIESEKAVTAGYYNSTGQFVPVPMRNGQNIHAWIEFDGTLFEINVTIAPIGIKKPVKPLLTYRDPNIANYIASDMYVGFSASKTTWVEAQRILAWSLSDVGIARDINTTNFPVFLPKSVSSSSLSVGAIVGISVGAFVFLILGLVGYYLYWKKERMERLRREKEDEVEDWELEYWPHRFSYEELSKGTNGFSDSELLGAGGFGKVYKATLPNNTEVAVKCVNHDSKQGLREFMAEISSLGRLQHKNLVKMRGWCRKGNELMLVYDYMPNGSLNRWIFDKPETLMSWSGRRQILADVAEGLNYLHNGWDQVVVHRDIKSHNILLDSELRGRVGDFGLAKLYQHGETPNTTRVVGTLGYLAPELATVAMPTASSDVFSYGVVVLEVACGRRPIETWVHEDEQILVDWVRDLYVEGKIIDAADKRIKEEYQVDEMENVLKLGLACCHPDPLRRPTMKEVVAILISRDEAVSPTTLLSELANDGHRNHDEDQRAEDEAAPLSSPV